MAGERHGMSDKTSALGRLERFYSELTSVDGVLRGLAKEGVAGTVTAADLYTRSLDCQNLGGFEMLGRIAALAAEHAALDGTSRVLDVGCGVGGPGRYLADRFGCAVIGVDLLPERIQAAATLTQMVSLTERVTYRQADAVDLPLSDATFDQAWMLDASVHVADKKGLFRELARVLKPQGLLVLHDHIGPLPASMRPVTRDAPYIAPSLLQMVRYSEGAGVRLVLWRDTTQMVLEWMESRSEELARRREEAAATDPARHERRLAYRTAYIQALRTGMRTGVLIASRAG